MIGSNCKDQTNFFDNQSAKVASKVKMIIAHSVYTLYYVVDSLHHREIFSRGSYWPAS